MRLKYQFETMELDDSVVAVPVGEGANYFHGVVKLNGTAALLMDLLKEERTEEELIEILENEYEVSREIIAADVHKCVSDFMEKGLLI